MITKAIGISGPSGSGKTTLIQKLVPIFTGRGLRVGTVKQARSDFDVDQPGKDSWRHRDAGAVKVLVSSSRRWVLMTELDAAPEPDIESHIGHFADCDLVIVEGFKHARIPTIEVWRAAVGRPILYPTDAGIIAIATDQEMSAPLPVFDLDAPTALASFIASRLSLGKAAVHQRDLAMEVTDARVTAVRA